MVTGIIMNYIYHTEQETKYPYTTRELKRNNPNTSFPSEIPNDLLAEYNVYPVTAHPQPEVDYTEVVVEQPPELINGTWHQAWTVRPATEEEIAGYFNGKKQEILQRVQQRLDQFARTRNYDGIMSLATYANSTITKFQTEGQYGVELRDQTWATCYQILAEVEAGTRPIPETYEEIEPELPPTVWPE
jgi:hypothetical protein